MVCPKDGHILSIPSTKAAGVLNLSSKILDKGSISVLRKGIKYVPTPVTTDRGDLQSANDGIARRLRLNFFFHGRNSATRDRNFRVKSNWTPKTNYPFLESELQILNLALGQLPVTVPKDNLKKNERISLKTLANNKNIIIKPADKGAVIVVMDTADYVAEGQRQLSHPIHYKKLNQPVFPQAIPKINEIFQDLLNLKFIDKGQYKYLACPTDPTPRRMYLLPKIHKDKDKWPPPGRLPPGRPIISDCGSDSYASAEYIDHFLAPLATRHPSYLKDTNHFLEELRNLKIQPNALLATIDVDSLYTNIDNTNGIQAVANAFAKYPDPKRPDKHICDLLKINLEYNDFEFNSEWYLQTWGTAMGKKFAPNYANLFLADWEREALEKSPLKPSFYRRYLDDIFIIWEHSKESFHEFINLLNSHHPSITVKAELDLKTINFLDVTVFKGTRFQDNGILDTKVFFKPTDTLELLHKDSYHPSHTFSGIIKSQILRYKRICNNKNDIEDACRRLFYALKPRGYSDRFLRNIKNQILNADPNFNKGCSNKCNGSRCQLCKKNIVIQATEFPGGPENSNTKFKLRTQQDCNSPNGIYGIRCDRCHTTYIGETGMKFRDRINVHLSDVRNKKPTPVGTHFNSDNCDITNFKVFFLESLPVSADKDVDKVKRLDLERKWQILVNSMEPHGMNTVPSPDNNGVIPFVITYSETAQKAAALVKKTFNTIKIKHPYIVFQPCVTAFKRGKNLRDLLVRGRLGKAPWQPAKHIEANGLTATTGEPRNQGQTTSDATDTDPGSLSLLIELMEET